MNVYEINKVAIKGNLNTKFYLYCLRKNKKLIKYAFLNLFNLFLSIFFKKYNDRYEKNKFKYLKYVENFEKLKQDFYKKNRYNKAIELENCFFIDRVPTILLEDKFKDNSICYSLDENYIVKLNDYKSLKNKCNKLFIRHKYNQKEIKAQKIYKVNNNKIKYIDNRSVEKYEKEKINLLKLNKFLLIFFLAFFITCISFCFAFIIVDLRYIMLFFNPFLFFMNYLPILLFMLLILLITKRLWASFSISSLLVMILGIANQTKLTYRDDIVKFSDLFLLKEALIISNEKGYTPIINWYTVIFIIIIILITWFLKEYYKKINVKFLKKLGAIFICLLLIFISYKKLYNDSKIYDKLGDTRYVNKWIDTRQYQVRGLIYPFIYTLEEGFSKPPKGYNEEKEVTKLSSYTYENIPDNKKVNIIAVMLEAYNDFSKFDIDFTEDIYKIFHNIQKKSISGNLVTNVFGGGTINTERAFLTSYYGGNNYRKKTNSHVWYFKEQDYITEAMHPIYGAFYNRASVNVSLGFDEYYYYENKFSKINEKFLDDIDFYDYIIEGYENAKKQNKPYFNFSVTYQNHGPYSTSSFEGKEYYFEQNGMEDDYYNLINKYFSNIKEVNIAMDKLINYFENEEKPTIVIFFGDHNPYLNEEGYGKLGINIDTSNIEGFLNKYETPYIIYGNNSAKKVFNKSFVGRGDTISPVFLMSELYEYLEWSGNEYLHYIKDLKEKMPVLSETYCYLNDEYVARNNEEVLKLIEDYKNISYYYSDNYRFYSK